MANEHWELYTLTHATMLIGMLPGEDAKRLAAYNDGVMTPFIEDATFLKLREVSLGWLVPQRLTSAAGLGVRDVRLGLSARNLKTWSDYSGLDPEVSNFGGLSKQFAVTFQPAQLERYGLTLNDLVEAIKTNNASAGGSALPRGSMSFVIGHVAIFTSWLLLNTRLLLGIVPFDPFPFGLLSLGVGLDRVAGQDHRPGRGRHKVCPVVRGRCGRLIDRQRRRGVDLRRGGDVEPDDDTDHDQEEDHKGDQQTAAAAAFGGRWGGYGGHVARERYLTAR